MGASLQPCKGRHLRTGPAWGHGYSYSCDQGFLYCVLISHLSFRPCPSALTSQRRARPRATSWPSIASCRSAPSRWPQPRPRRWWRHPRLRRPLLSSKDLQPRKFSSTTSICPSKPVLACWAFTRYISIVVTDRSFNIDQANAAVLLEVSVYWHGCIQCCLSRALIVMVLGQGWWGQFFFPFLWSLSEL